LKRVDGFKVQVVSSVRQRRGTLGLLQHDLAEEQTRGFASGEGGVGLLEPLFAAGKSIWPRIAADVFFWWPLGRRCAAHSATVVLLVIEPV